MNKAKTAAIVGVVMTVIALGFGSATAQTTTTGTSTAKPGADNGNARAAKIVENDPLAGLKGTGLTRGVTSTTVKVGCYQQAAGFPGAEDGFKARFDRANKDKELPGGRKIELSACQEDSGNPQTNLQIVQRLVQQEGDFAVLGASVGVGTASTNFVNQNQVPVFGLSVTPGMCGTRWVYGYNGCLITDYPNKTHTVYISSSALGPMAAAGLTPKTTKVALQFSDLETGHSSSKTIGDLFKTLGAKVVYNEANVPSGGAGVNYTPYAQAIVSSGANLLETLTDFQTVPGLTGAVTAGGFTGSNVNFVGYVPGLLQASAQLAKVLDGVFVVAQTVPAEQNTAWVKQMQKDLQASGAKSTNLSFGNSLAYAEADQFVSMLKAIGKTLNTKTFDQKLNGGGYTYKPSVAGGPGQMEYPSMHFISTDCGAMLQVEGTNYKLVTPFSCYPSVVKK